MSTVFNMLGDKPKIEDVISTLEAIGIEVAFNHHYSYDGESNDEDIRTQYVIGCDTYGWTQMHSKGSCLDHLHQFAQHGQPHPNIIDVVINSFNLMYYIDLDYGKQDFCEDLEGMSSKEFFYKHYPDEVGRYETVRDMDQYFEEDYQCLAEEIKLRSRSFFSYMFEYALTNNEPVKEVVPANVIQYINKVVKEYEKSQSESFEAGMEDSI